MDSIRKDFLLYQNDSISLFASKRLNSFEKLKLITVNEANMFMKVLREEKLSIDEEKDYLRWIKTEPSLFYNKSENKNQSSKNIAQKLKAEATAYKKVKKDSDVIEYHKSEIQDALVQFDYNETTLSHMFRNKNEALANRSYGEALCDKILESLTINDSLNILEIGCGTGLLAFNFLNRLKEKHPSVYNKSHYTLFDLSPALAKKQKEVCSDHLDMISFISGNIEEYDFESQYDLILSNEVIADLNVSVGDKKTLKKSSAELLVEKYSLNIDNFPNKYILNTEAIKLIPKIKNLLNDKGIAFLSEYGSLDEMPKVVELPGHNEYSINFGHLAKVWSGDESEYSYGTVGDYLDFNPSYKVLDESVRELLIDHLLPFLGIKEMPRESYDLSLMKLVVGKKLQDFIYLPFSEIKEKRGTLNPYEFKYLLLKNK